MTIVIFAVVILAILFSLGSMATAYAAILVDTRGRDDTPLWIITFTFAGLAVLLISVSVEIAAALP